MITGLVMINAGPFRGRHELTFGAHAYAFTARREDDPKKSNASGKSFILEMITFALTGVLKKSRSYDADGWITHGEKNGEVIVTLEDGAQISRSRVRGKATQIRFTRPGHGECAQDAAAAAILKHIGLSALDFSNAAYFEQKKMARLVDPELTDPSDRMKIVSGWFGLGIAERADKRAGEQASEIERELTPLIARHAALKEVHAAPSDEIDADETEREIERLRVRAIELREERDLAARVADAIEIVEEQAQRIADGKEKRKVIEAAPTIDAEAQHAEEIIAGLQGVRANLVGAVQTKKAVSLGQFDGACPVIPMECPATALINKRRGASAKALADARAACTKAEEALDAARLEHAPTLTLHREIEIVRREIERMREHVREAAPAARDAKALIESAPEDIIARRDANADELNTLDLKIGELRGALASATAAKKRKADNAAALAKLDEQVSAIMVRLRRKHRESAIYKMAQRRVAERALSVVEVDANVMLSEAGVDLTVTARWEREASGWAKSCDECGASFPASAKIRECERCHAQRGAHTIQRLDFVLSDRSGAYDDLGGVTMQLAAGGWLIASRQSPWSTALIDEPYSACDPSNRQGLARTLAKILGRGVFRQAFVVSHTPDTVDMMPHRVEIVVLKNGERTVSVLR